MQNTKNIMRHPITDTQTGIRRNMLKKSLISQIRRLSFALLLMAGFLFLYPNTQVHASTVGSYKSKNESITVYKKTYNKVTYYAAHVQLKNYKNMYLAKANKKRSNSFQYVSSIAKANHAILAVNGPFNGANSKHWDAFGGKKYYKISNHNFYEIVKGTYYKGKTGGTTADEMASYSNKTGILAPACEQKGVTSGMTLKTAAAKKLISDTFQGDTACTLLKNGKIQVAKGGDKRQRTFIGTNGKAGDIWIVVCNGSKTKGLNAYQEAAILKKLGCSYGYNLFGAGNTTMIFKGKKLNNNPQRKGYDALVVGK